MLCYRNLDDIKSHYNEFSSGGNLYGGNNPDGQKMTTQQIPTFDEYMAQWSEQQRLNALEKSRTRAEPAKPLIPLSADKKDLYIDFIKIYDDEVKITEDKWREKYKTELSEDYEKYGSYLQDFRHIESSSLPASVRDRILRAERWASIKDWRNTYQRAVDSNTDEGESCLATALDNYGKWQQGDSNTQYNPHFAENGRQIGFIPITKEQMKPGDLVQAEGYNSLENRRLPRHAMLFEGYQGDTPTYNYSRGGHDSKSLVTGGRYPADNFLYHRFVGSPSDSIKVRKEYNLKYAPVP